MYNWITLLYIHLKLRQHCSSAVLQHKMLKRSIVRRNFKLSPCSWHGNSPGISQWGCRTEVSNLGPAGQTRPGPPIYKCGQAHPFTNAARPTHLQTRPGPSIYKQTRPGPPIYMAPVAALMGQKRSWVAANRDHSTGSAIFTLCSIRGKFANPGKRTKSASSVYRWPLEVTGRIALVVQLLRVHRSMQEMQVQPLVWEDPTCHGATGSTPRNHVHTPQPLSLCPGARALQQRTHCTEKPAHHGEE